MAQEIKFSLLYRDMWQSSGKYVPTVEQLTEVAPAIIDMGCFDRIETNGGGFEQINLLLVKTQINLFVNGHNHLMMPVYKRIC